MHTFISSCTSWQSLSQVLLLTTALSENTGAFVNRIPFVSRVCIQVSSATNWANYIEGVHEEHEGREGRRGMSTAKHAKHTKSGGDTNHENTETRREIGDMYTLRVSVNSVVRGPYRDLRLYSSGSSLYTVDL